MKLCLTPMELEGEQKTEYQFISHIKTFVFKMPLNKIKSRVIPLLFKNSLRDLFFLIKESLILESGF